MKLFLKSVLIFVFYVTTINSANANISMPEIFKSNMVLQQKSEVKIWGWAKPGEPVKLEAGWLEQNLEAKADNQGTWSLLLKTPSAGGPYTLRLKGFNEIVFENVLIGEVWLVSGQSNMEWSASAGLVNKDEEIANANYPEIRFFTVNHSTALYPQNHFDGEWTVCTPETMQSFSAVGYFFARQLQGKLGVPIGIVNSSWGGTPAEAWMPEDAFEKDFFLKEAASLLKPVPWGPVEKARIYNSMISPLIPFQIAGVLWYQGEANTINFYAYKELLSALIGSWRNKWNSDFPFYFAQIAPYKYGNPFEGVGVREEQRKALEVPNTGMVVLSDIGDTLDIHPKNKQDVGLRFANLALNRHYKAIKVEDSGPLFKEMKMDKNMAVISFDHAEGLYATGKEITCFEIAGEDNIYYPAEATIKNLEVIVQSNMVKQPVKVRFAWRNTATPNLFNGANLPASCFSTE